MNGLRPCVCVGIGKRQFAMTTEIYVAASARALRAASPITTYGICPTCPSSLIDGKNRVVNAPTSEQSQYGATSLECKDFPVVCRFKASLTVA